MTDMRLLDKPHQIIGTAADPYLLRWFLTPWRLWKERAKQNPTQLNRIKAKIAHYLPSMYLHCIVRDDDDRALHDHPWLNISIVLAGAYREIVPDLAKASTPHMRVWDMPKITRLRRRGSFIFRRATAAHRLEVAEGPVWTLFIVGPKCREWGFHCSWGWRHWKEFVNPDNHGEVGAGCE